MKVGTMPQRTLSLFLSIMMFFSCFNIINVSADDIDDSEQTVSSESGVSGNEWEFDVYYLNQDDKYSVEKNSDFNLKYQMEFHASRDLEANSVEIRIPAKLLTYRDGTYILPTEISVPQGTPESPVSNKVTSFNYYIDGDDLVFFNYKQIDSGSNIVWQVLYKGLDAMRIVDETSWKLEPTITVKIDEDTVETQNLQALEGLVDTSATLRSVSKETLKISGKSYGPGLYTKSQVKEYISGELPSWCSGNNFDDYVYVVWDVKAIGNASQPWSMSITDTTSTSASASAKCCVVGYKNASSGKYNVSVPGGINTSESSPYVIENIVESSDKEEFGVRFYVVCAYPKDYASEGTTLTNNINITLTPIDGKDSVQTKSDSASWAYADYDWKYSGNVIGITKSGGNTQKGILEVYKQASEEKTDKVKLSYNTISKCYGYGFTHYIEGNNLGEYIDGTSYTVSTFDDVLYVYPSGSAVSNKKMLGSDDYYFTNVVITQSDRGYDVWEDTLTSPENTSDIDQSIIIYAMYEGSEEWEKVATVPWSNSGTMTYTFTSEQLAKKPWRVRADHTSINYSTTCTIGVEVCLKHDSPIINEILGNNSEEDNDNNVEELVIENLSGVTGKYNNEYFHDDGTENYVQYPDNLQTASQKLYDTLPMRDNAAATITALTKQAASYKTAKSSNDVTNARVNVEYTLTAYDGYEVSSNSVAEYLASKGFTSPGRNDIVFYDLLPYGMKFDPSKPVTAGRITNLSGTTYRTQYKSWNKSNVTVTVETEDNYNGTGRTLVIFHVSYSGGDSSSYSNNLWFEGWGVNFSTYYEWKDIEIIQNSTNISAFMPKVGDLNPLLGLDDQIFDDSGADGAYEDFGSDINRDEITDIKNVLYAQNSNWEEVITASSSGIEKLVKADNDTFGVFKNEATVEYEHGYTYEITLNNTVGKVKNIVIYDRLENASVDRIEAEKNMDFDTDPWHGTFDSVITKGLEQLGIEPVIYYSDNINAPITAGSQQPSDVLTEENDWYKAEDWEKKGYLNSQVKAIAIDISKTTDGEDFILEQDKSVSFQIKMTAPEADDEQLQKSKYTYNNTSYYSYDVETETSATVASNSVRVSLGSDDVLEVQKEFGGDVPELLENSSFEFYLYQNGEWRTNEKINFANKEYELYVKDENNEWKQSEGLYATDANGMLTLHAGEKAVFRDLPDASSIIVEEEDNIFWDSTRETVTEVNGTSIYTVTVTNKYRPILYLQKKLQSVPDGYDTSNDTFTFQVFVKRETDNGMEWVPLANTEYWYVDKALTNGGVPNKIASGKTDDEGCIEIHAGEVIGVSPGDVGTEYKVVEILDENSLWICENDTVEGKVILNGSVVTFTNIYRLKDLYITKEITHQDASKCTQAFTFKITDSEGNAVVGNEWVLLDSDGKETEISGTLDGNGEFSVACAGKTVKVKGFEANKTYTVQETESGTLYKAVNGGIAEATMPLYSLSSNVTITNDWQKCPLSVSKTVMYDIKDTTKAAEVAEKSFEMTVKVEGEPIGNYPYTVVDSYGNTSTGSTDADGKFQIKNGETVTFEDIGMYGDSFEVTETADEDYPQIYPADGAAQTGTLLQDENKVSFINGSGNNLIISKQYVGNDDVSNQYAEKTKTDVSGMLRSGVNITLKYEVDGVTKIWPEENTTVDVINGSGTVTSATWLANSTFSLSAWSIVVIPADSIPSDAVYYVSESESNQHRIYYYSYSKDDGTSEMHYLEISQKVPANDAAVTGTIESNPVAMIINEVNTLNVESEISKRMVVGSTVPEGAKLVWRVEQYVDGKWQPAENIKYMVNTVSSAYGYILEGTGTAYTGSDGIIEIQKHRSGYPIVGFIDVEVDINVQEPVEGQYRVIELYEESDESWDMLAGYGKANNLSFSTSLSSDEAAAFVNSNVNTPLEIEKVMETDCDETFAMTLKQVISTSEDGEIVESAVRAGIEYIVYDSETGEKLSESVTDKYGNIYLKAGQFARIELPTDTVWTVSEETNPQYTLKEMSGTPEGDERLTELNANLMLISMQYEFEIEDISINQTMVSSIVYDANTGEKIILNKGDVVIPEYIIYNNQKYRVTGIADSAFKNNKLITSITLPNTLETIGSSAFYNCTALTGNLDIPEGVTSIGSYTFYGCSGLTGELVIPDSVTSIGNYAFCGCSGLESVTISGNVTIIRDFTFNGCSGLTGELVIPDSVTSIGNYAFYGCRGLTGELVIPDSVTSIGSYAFYGCSGLTGELVISDSVTSIGSYAFSSCTKLESVTIEEGVESIGERAFYGCDSLESVTIPGSVTNIKDYTFYSCDNLVSVTIEEGVTSIGFQAFAYCQKLESVTIPDSVTSIGSCAFYGCSGLTGELIITDSVTSIGSSAFNNCDGLESVTIPGSVTNIGSSAFYNCDNLTSVTIEEGVESIGNSAFEDCTALISVTIPCSVIGIGSYAFYNCSGLTGDLVIPDSVTSIGTYAFDGCKGLTSVTIGNGVTKIFSYVFGDCTELTSVTIPNSVTSISTKAFYNCTKLESITIPSSVTSIGSTAFTDCSALTSITVEQAEGSISGSPWGAPNATVTWTG